MRKRVISWTINFCFFLVFSWHSLTRNRKLVRVFAKKREKSDKSLIDLIDLSKNDNTSVYDDVNKLLMNSKCRLMDRNGKTKTLGMMPPDGTVIFSTTVFGEARLQNLMDMLTELLKVEKRVEELKLPNIASKNHFAMITVSGNKTLIPLLHMLSKNNEILASSIIIAELTQDYGPISRIGSVDACFNEASNYTFVVGDDDVVYNQKAVFSELPNMLKYVQTYFKSDLSNIMVGYTGMNWQYPTKWGGFLKGAQFGRHVGDSVWNSFKNFGETSCIPKLGKSFCTEIIKTGILENYGLVAFHRKAILPSLYESHFSYEFPKTCFWGDDFWLAYYAFSQNISMYVVKSQVTNPPTALIKKLQQLDGSVGKKAGGAGSNIGNYRLCEKKIVQSNNSCSWCI